MTAPAATARRSRVWFAAWLLVGASYTVALLGALTIGVFVLPFSVAGSAVLVLRRASHPGLPGLLSGAGVPLLVVAYFNRSGPGTVCASSRPGEQSCVEQSSPWIWLVLGLLLVLAGLAVFVWGGHHRRRVAAALPQR